MNNDQQPNDELEALMAKVPGPSTSAKANAKLAAMQAFAEQAAQQNKKENPQGFLGRLRHTLTNKLHEGNAMQTKWIYSGALASVCVVGLTAVLVKNTQPELILGAQPGITEAKIATVEMADSEAEIAPSLKKEKINSLADESSISVADRAAHEPVMVEQAAEADFSSAPMPAPMAMAPAQQRQLAARESLPVKGRSTKAESALVGASFYSASKRALADMPPAINRPSVGEDEFTPFENNPVLKVQDEPVSTFSVDVDTAAYSFVRRQLNRGVLPQASAVRLEEMVNYFDYQYPLPATKEQPFATNISVVDSPWKPGNKLVHIGIKGYDLDRNQWPKSNLVFLLDVSGSMGQADKLPLVKQSMELLLSQLNPSDTVAIAVYAGAAGTVLPPTQAKEKQTIMQALENLQAGGSTAGGEGIKLAYQLAEANYDKNAVNRVILATDGGFNVGIHNHDELKDFIERKRDAGVFLSVLGFGQGNYHDNLMQSLAQNGNGVAAYIDTLSEAQKVLVHQATSSLFTIAKDVKIQVEFNPATVSEYRLLGFETRHLEQQDFNNDKVDAGDIGAGHTVTAIYEISPVGSGNDLIGESRYGPRTTPEDGKSGEYGFLKLRYKLPNESQSKLIEQPIAIKSSLPKAKLAQEVNFSIAVAGFSQLLRGGEYTQNWQYDDAISLAQGNKGEDPYGYRTEFIQLVRKAKLAKEMP